MEYKSEVNEDFIFFHLDVQDMNSIENSLKSTMAIEKMEGDNAYNAGDHGTQEAERYIRILKLPPVLIFQLKRFDYIAKTGKATKINQEIDISETLDLDDLLEFDELSDKNTKNIYKLHSILMHKGDVGSGHYFAYIRNRHDKDYWWEFNDESCHLRNKDYVLKSASGKICSDFRVQNNKLFERKKCNTCNAYMLFYIRESESEEMLDPPTKDEIPPSLLAKFDDERQKVSKINERAEAYYDTDPILVISQDHIRNWYSFGVFPCTKKTQKEASLLDNSDFRKKIYLTKKLTFFQLIVELMRKLNNPEISCVLMYSLGESISILSKYRISKQRYFNR